MSQINGAGRIAEIVRQQLETSRGLGRQTPPKANSFSAATGSTGPARTRLDVTVARRVRAIDPQDPDRRRKAMRVFLESVLLAELGESLINDDGFYQLVEQVQQQMAADSGLAEIMDQAADLLLVAKRA